MVVSLWMSRERLESQWLQTRALLAQACQLLGCELLINSDFSCRFGMLNGLSHDTVDSWSLLKQLLACRSCLRCTEEECCQCCHWLCQEAASPWRAFPHLCWTRTRWGGWASHRCFTLAANALAGVSFTGRLVACRPRCHCGSGDGAHAELLRRHARQNVADKSSPFSAKSATKFFGSRTAGCPWLLMNNSSRSQGAVAPARASRSHGIRKLYLRLESLKHHPLHWTVQRDL